ncbi:MAG: helix-turn-helix transcriptional regulator [archaeon]|nr:MAG: helix-turn-helix transcriptional regulator [archaeon]
MKKEILYHKKIGFIGEKWTSLILLEIYGSQSKWKRFSELKKSLGNITSKTLSTKLKRLEKEKLIKKRVDNSVVPIKSEYSLTIAGKDFINILESMEEWAMKWKY